jgi:O-antigen ligase
VLLESIAYKRFRKELLPFIMAAFVSLVANNKLFGIEFVKYCLWIIIAFTFGPCFTSINLFRLKKTLWDLQIVLFTIITICSFLWISFKLPSIKLTGTGVYSDSYFRNGIALHEMSLAPIACISAIYYAHRLFNRRLTKSSFFYCLIIFIISVIVIIMASSRIVILGFLIVFLMMFLSNAKVIIQKLGNNYLLFFLFFVCIGYLSLYGSTVFKTFVADNSRLEIKGVNNSRYELWNARLSDFKESPIIGVGFNSISTNTQENRLVRSGLSEGGRIEFGSLYLQILSTTGILGCIAFSLFLYKAYKRIVLKKFKALKYDVHLPIVLFLTIHGLAEAYAFSPGAHLCVFFWLSFSQMASIKTVLYHKKRII